MADAFVADLASGLVSKLVSLATEEIIQAWNVHEDLETLRERLESIVALLSDAHTKKLSMSVVHNWFNKLEDVAHVAVVFMDQLAYEVTRRKVENHRKVRGFVIPSKNSILYRFKVAHKIKSIQTSFDKIFKWAGDLGLEPVAHLSSIVQLSEIQSNTPPFEDESHIVGRDNDVSYLVQTLSKNHQDTLPVIGVVGMGGQGKTTLVRMVYNRDDVTNMFPKRMWVTVSDHFDFMKILNHILESLTSTTSVLKNTEGVINAIKKSLEKDNFLLVLDDVWNEKPEEWDKLRNSLLGVRGARGEDSWALFKQRAFSHGVPETEVFAALGRKMVDRCGGLPLAIKTLGGLLHSKKSEKEWLLIQNSEIWKSKGVLASLRLSYDHLPYPSLKQCFAYCSIVPKDSYIFKDEMVQIWMALGFLMPPRGSNALMEDVGNEYFNILLWNSLLQDVERNVVGNIIGCKMHDLVHDLAIDISEHHSLTMQAGHELNHFFKAKYVRIDEGVLNIKPSILKRNFERVQVLYAGACILNGMLPYLKNLTVLVLNNDRVTTKLPRSLRTMKYLKHLDISCFRFKQLPSYITDFYNLQTLRVWNLDELPKRFCNLINLRHLFFEDPFPETRCMLTGIERLTGLQTLPHFVVDKNKNCVIGQLEGMQNLRGKLMLYGLGDIKNMEESCKASLSTKSNIERLKLVWSKNDDEMEDTKNEELEYNDGDVMEGLKPHTNLITLSIVNFKGKNFASWITVMMNLVKITLTDCKRCEGFPPLGHLPKLREMEIFRMNNVKVFTSDFYGGQGSCSSESSKSGTTKTVTTLYPSLVRLRLCDLPKLEELIDPLMRLTGHEDKGAVIAFPKLEELRLGCRKLISIPSGCFTSLKDLTIDDLDSSSMILARLSKKLSSLTFLQLLNIRDRGGSCSSSSSNMDSIIDELLKNNSLSLTILSLDDCHGLTCLSPGVAISRLSVVNCPDLIRINVVEKSGSLNDLTIARCPSLSDWVFVQSGWEKVKSILPAAHIDARLSSTFPALTALGIFRFKGVKALPDSLAKLPSLNKLLIWSCENLRSLPLFEEPDSLDLLTIGKCPILEENCKMGSGSEWFKIQHISHVAFTLYPWHPMEDDVDSLLSEINRKELKGKKVAEGKFLLDWIWTFNEDRQDKQIDGNPKKETITLSRGVVGMTDRVK
ncbi:hypothetical protein POM88_016466 [Heracleum sosnowskyi]|uniref:Uncharacterized protein n=1 Tax=Heracleum sosnowskyi TaxID=360622 RepID=A0AAD8IP09_9APIA|nr:hypothetical protein POM88_016466 [Heracleum sosnowskyi]